MDDQQPVMNSQLAVPTSDDSPNDRPKASGAAIERTPPMLHEMNASSSDGATEIAEKMPNCASLLLNLVDKAAQGDDSSSNAGKKLVATSKRLEPKRRGSDQPHSPEVALAIEEMRRYYESEIGILRRQLRGIYGDNAMAEDSLSRRCHALEAQLQSANNEAELLREQVNGLKLQMESWPNKVMELEDDNSKLRSRLDEMRQANQNKEEEIVDSQNQILDLEQQLWQERSKHQDDDFVEGLMTEYQELVKNYDLVKSILVETESKLFSAHAETAEHVRKNAELEAELRKSESEISVLRRRLLHDREVTTPSSPTPHFMGNSETGNAAYERDFKPLSQLIKEHAEKRRPSNTPDRLPIPNPMNSMMTASCYGGLLKDKSTTSNVPVPTYNRSPVPASLQDRFARSSLRTPPRSSSVAPVQKATDSTRLPGPGFSLPPHMDVTEASARSPSLDRVFNRRPSIKKAYSDYTSMDIHQLVQHYDQMQIMKRRLETDLCHLPSSGPSRNKRVIRQQREQLEEQLDHLDHDLGAIRMILKQHNIL